MVALLQPLILQCEGKLWATMKVFGVKSPVLCPQNSNSIPEPHWSGVGGKLCLASPGCRSSAGIPMPQFLGLLTGLGLAPGHSTLSVLAVHHPPIFFLCYSAESG